MSEPRKVLTGNRRLCSTRPSQWVPRRLAWYDLLLRRVVVRVQHVPHRGFCVRSVYPRGGGQMDRLFILAPPEYSMKRVKVGGSAENSVASHIAAVESNVLAKLASLVAHCAVTKYEDGEPRRPGWWTVKTLGAAWVVQVKDPDSCSQLQATAQSLDDALALADLLLSSEQAPWEPDPWLASQQKRGKK